MTDENPLSHIEQVIATKDTGRYAYLMYKGAREEGAGSIEALAIVSAYYEGMFRALKEEDDGNNDS